MFVKAIWKYQYTKHPVELTDKMYDALYEEAVGVPFLAVNIYKLVQEYAIYSGEETFTDRSFHTIASQKMRLTLEMRRALLSEKDINLEQYLDLTPFKPIDFKSTIIQDINPPEPKAPEPVQKCDIRETAVQALIAFGIDRPSASKHVGRILAKNPSYTQSSVIAREAYDDFLQYSSGQSLSDNMVGITPVLADNYDTNLSQGYIGL